MPNVGAIIGGVVVGIAAVTGTAVALWLIFGKKKILITLIDPDVKTALRIVDRQVYAANKNPNFPNGGKMTQYLMNIPLTQYIDVRGPDGNLHYLGNGKFDIKPDSASPPQSYTAKTVSMICGGSGITPMFQLLLEILKSKDDNTRLALLFANKTEEDILLRDELEDLQSKHPDQFRLWYTLSTAPEYWNYSTGHVNDTMIAEHLYPPGDDSLVLLCGPPPMVELACYPNLRKLNYPRDRMYTY